MDGDENRSPANLILLCIKHAATIDLSENVDRYPADLLWEWEAEQLRSYDSAVGRAWICQMMRRQKLSRLLGVVPKSTSRDDICGRYRWPCARCCWWRWRRARTGIDWRSRRLCWSHRVGWFARRGAGGRGWHWRRAGGGRHPPNRRNYSHRGFGFSSGTDGQDGGASIVSIGDVELVRAEGGASGLAGTGVRRADSRFAVSALMLVDYVQVRQGLASIVGGGWQSCSVLNLPTPVTWCRRR